MNITVIGTGYVGLVTGTCLAETGNHVTCVDIDARKVQQLQQGITPIFEPGLQPLLERNIQHGRISFTTNIAEAIPLAKVIFLALPTPPGADGSADLSAVLKVAEQLGSLIKEYKVIINKSTVPVGTADRVRDAVAKNATVEFDVISNPEFLREGVAVDDFLKPDRVVVGTSSMRARAIMEELYEPYVRQGNPIIFMDERSSEMTKYAANSYLAARISFMNEIANLCERVGADVDMVRRGMGSDSRIGKRFLFPGLGYGGSCFPKDVKALYSTARENDYAFTILEAVMKVNDKQRHLFIEKIHTYFGKKLQGLNIALWGLAFKPNTDDIREAPALTVVDELLKAGAKVSVFDPEGMNNFKAIYGDKLIYGIDEYAVLKDADALVIVTEWNIFRTPSFERMGSLMRNKAIFDGRNLYQPEKLREEGFYYNSIGREIIEDTI